MATKKKADKPAAKKKEILPEVKPRTNLTGASQAWESGKAIKSSADTSK